jgi:hypothetical protein
MGFDIVPSLAGSVPPLPVLSQVLPKENNTAGSNRTSKNSILIFIDMPPIVYMISITVHINEVRTIIITIRGIRARGD